MITQMNRLENAARLAMADLRQPPAPTLQRPPRQVPIVPIVALAAAASAVMAILFAALS